MASAVDDSTINIVVIIIILLFINSVCVCVCVTDIDVIVEYFEFVGSEVASNKDDGSVLDAFRPALDHICQQLSHVRLGDSKLISFADLVTFFTRNSHLAQVSSLIGLHLGPDFSKNHKLIIKSSQLCRNFVITSSQSYDRK